MNPNAQTSSPTPELPVDTSVRVVRLGNNDVNTVAANQNTQGASVVVPVGSGTADVLAKAHQDIAAVVPKLVSSAAQDRWLFGHLWGNLQAIMAGVNPNNAAKLVADVTRLRANMAAKAANDDMAPIVEIPKPQQETGFSSEPIPTKVAA